MLWVQRWFITAPGRVAVHKSSTRRRSSSRVLSCFVVVASNLKIVGHPSAERSAAGVRGTDCLYQNNRQTHSEKLYKQRSLSLSLLAYDGSFHSLVKKDSSLLAVLAGPIGPGRAPRGDKNACARALCECVCVWWRGKSEHQDEAIFHVPATHTHAHSSERREEEEGALFIRRSSSIAATSFFSFSLSLSLSASSCGRSKGRRREEK